MNSNKIIDYLSLFKSEAYSNTSYRSSNQLGLHLLVIAHDIHIFSIGNLFWKVHLVYHKESINNGIIF